MSQSLNALQETVPALAGHGWAYGLAMAGLVGVVIIGGIRRIAMVADKVVPFMAMIYVGGCLFVLLANAAAVPVALGEIVRQAVRPDAAYGSFVGVLVLGFQRAAFSNEAGAGSAAIAHSAARTELPVREDRGSPRALHRHGGDLHHDGAGNRRQRRLRGPGVRATHCRTTGRGADVQGVRGALRTVPIRAVRGCLSCSRTPP